MGESKILGLGIPACWGVQNLAPNQQRKTSSVLSAWIQLAQGQWVNNIFSEDFGISSSKFWPCSVYSAELHPVAGQGQGGSAIPAAQTSRNELCFGKLPGTGLVHLWSLWAPRGAPVPTASPKGSWLPAALCPPTSNSSELLDPQQSLPGSPEWAFI